MNWSDEENITTIYRLLNVKGFGVAQTNKLLWSFYKKINSSSQFESAISDALQTEDAESFKTSYKLFRHDPYVCYVSVLDENKYPNRLRDTLRQNTPTILSCIGNLELLHKKSVGFSGSRKVSDKGLWITRDCASQLSEKDICIISGYASGVDLEAHKTALEHGGSTIIVLPEGISSFHIRNELKSVWDWNRILVISEFKPEDRWLAARAMRRNQTIIGLSDAMLVIEAGETGGSLDAGMRTINYGKSLFVPLYGEFPKSALGNNELLRMGANKLMRRRDNHTNIDMVLECINGDDRKQQTLPF